MKKTPYIAALLLTGCLSHAQVPPVSKEREVKLTDFDINTDAPQGDIIEVPLKEAGQGEYDKGPVEKMPEYPGGINQFYKYIDDKLQRSNLDGGYNTKNINVYASFIVEADGSLSNIKILRDPDSKAGKEVERLIKAHKIKWKPGIVAGKPAPVSFNVAITIKAVAEQTTTPISEGIRVVEISEDDTTMAPIASSQNDTDILVGATLQIKPEFPGGNKAFLTFITNNIKKENLVAGAEGKELKTAVSFVVEKDGSMTDVKILRDPGYGMGKEVARILKLVKVKWKPGIQNGKPVRASNTLPVNYTVPN
jgi:hypothetical protein